MISVCYNDKEKLLVQEMGELAFLLFQQAAVQSTFLFLCYIIDKISQTSSVFKKSAAASATSQDLYSKLDGVGPVDYRPFPN